MKATANPHKIHAGGDLFREGADVGVTPARELECPFSMSMLYPLHALIMMWKGGEGRTWGILGHGEGVLK